MWWFLSLLLGELSIVYCSTLGQIVYLEEISVVWDVVVLSLLLGELSIVYCSNLGQIVYLGEISVL
mgnify:CR=1 FL=1